MELTKEATSVMFNLGYEEKDLRQIEEAMRRTKYYLNYSTKISSDDAVKLLGMEGYLSGLGRSAFHWSAVRYTKDGSGSKIWFDSSRLFRDTRGK